jgi:hypothetical protein
MLKTIRARKVTKTTLNTVTKTTLNLTTRFRQQRSAMLRAKTVLLNSGGDSNQNVCSLFRLLGHFLVFNRLDDEIILAV